MKFSDILAREPVAAVEAVRMIILLAMAFGLNVTNSQLGAILACVSAVAALFVRGIVTSPARAHELLMTPPPGSEPARRDEIPPPPGAHQ